MGNADEQHFDSYRAQTRVKHAILEGYLPSYYNIIKRIYSSSTDSQGVAPTHLAMVSLKGHPSARCA